MIQDAAAVVVGAARKGKKSTPPGTMLLLTRGNRSNCKGPMGWLSTTGVLVAACAAYSTVSAVPLIQSTNTTCVASRLAMRTHALVFL